ncbi:MAG: Glutamine--scyllo-inositol transaminase, partial [Microbacteriaceae bacterium]|nr:Glutamine--scyllo-inositol transaminase [Microbacteriaceae bacterium]
LVPLPVDLDPITLAPTPATAAAASGQRTDVVAIVVAHLHGDPLDLAALDAWRRQRGLRLIEDCAQAHGARREGRHVGHVGDAATYSFYPTKNLGAVGDAGAVVFAESEVASHARQLAQYGWDDSHSIAFARGRNSRLDPIQAAILQARLQFLDSRNARRLQILNRYRAVVRGSTFLGDPQLGVAHHAVVRSDDRDGLARHLSAMGIRTAVHYPFVVGDMPGLQLQDARTPVARTLAGHILSLPCTPELTEDEILRVESALAGWEAA